MSVVSRALKSERPSSVGGPAVVGPEPDSLVKSAARIMQIFEYFQEVGRPARAIEIGEALELPKSSALGLLKTLVETGYLSFNSDRKTYFPSFRIIYAGARLSSVYFSELGILDLMNDLHTRTGECVALTVQNDCYMQCVSMLRPPGVATVFQEGLKTPVLGSAAGGALMASMTDREVVELIARGIKRQPVREREATSALVLEMLGQFRKQGYAVGYLSESAQGRTVAITLPIQPGNVPLVLGVGGPSCAVTGREPEIAALMRNLMQKYLTPHGMDRGG